MKIPKIIHQIWLGPHKKPDIWMNSWKIDFIKDNPDYTYKLWTEKEIHELDLINRQIYDNEKFYICKSDIARYEILLKYGGIYIDSDSLYIKENKISFTDLNIDKSAFAAREPINKQFIANGVIGFEKNHIILEKMIHFIKSNYYQLKNKYKKEREVWLITGPEPFTKMVNDKKDYITIFDNTYFYPESFHKNNLNIDKNNLHNLYPQSMMFQFGYTTNNILHNNVMKKYVSNTSALDYFFDKIFIINLKYRQDRLNQCLKQLKKYNINNYEIFEAIRPIYKDIPKEYYNKLVVNQAVWYVTGAVGCKMSHYKVIETAKKRNYNNFLVLEDDFLINENDFEKQIIENLNNLPNDWDMFYLGGNNLIAPKIINENIHKVLKINTTHSYAMKKSVYDFCIENMNKSGTEVDDFYKNTLQKNKNVYTIYPSLIKQMKSKSDIFNSVMDYKFN